MPKIRKIDDDAVVERLTRTFKDLGYEGASLTALSDATGLKKSSLYHRFPNGKEQMAEEVLGRVRQALDIHVFPVLHGRAPVREKMAHFAKVMDAVYASGNESCLLNMLCPPRGADTACGTAINDTFRKLREGLAQVAIESGAPKKTALLRAEQALVELQGSLVVARGTGDVAVFGRMLSRLPGIVSGQPDTKAAKK